MTKLELINKTEEEINNYIYYRNQTGRFETERVWNVAYNKYQDCPKPLSEYRTSEWADIWHLDDTKNYLSIVTVIENYYIEYSSTFEEAQRWVIETLQTKASLKLINT